MQNLHEELRNSSARRALRVKKSAKGVASPCLALPSDPYQFALSGCYFASSQQEPSSQLDDFAEVLSKLIRSAAPIAWPDLSPPELLDELHPASSRQKIPIAVTIALART